MTEPELNGQGRYAARARSLLLAAVVIAIVSVTVSKLVAAKPQLDLVNSGTAFLVVRFETETYVIQPGEVWSTRFRAGDTIELIANVGVASRTITLEQHGQPSGSPPRIRAEARLESPTSIAFGYTDHE